LLAAAKKELINIANNFPGKLAQFGFFTVDDDHTPDYTDSLWHWIYPKLASQFDGAPYPHVAFFQEDLAAARLSAAP
jgi:hypothetical protein